MIITKKVLPFLILVAFLTNADAQVLSQEEWQKRQLYYELHHYLIDYYAYQQRSNILRVHHETYAIESASSDTTRMIEQVEYYDGEGHLSFMRIRDWQDSSTRHWLRQSVSSSPSFTIYTDGTKSAQYSDVAIDAHQHELQLVQGDLNRQLLITIDTTARQLRSDLRISQCHYDDQGFLSKMENFDPKDSSHFSLDFQVLTIDEKQNWTSRMVSYHYQGGANTFLQKRSIQYSDEYEIARYLELVIDSFYLDKQRITDPEQLQPEQLTDAGEREQQQQKWKYEAVQELFHQKFFNQDYFFKFSMNAEEADTILEERLFKYLKTYVFDLKNKRSFRGRTNSKRWFEKTRSFGNLEQMEEAPTATERWEQVNAYRCRVYTRVNAQGQEEAFFVAEDLPFINYADFAFRLPGFIMKSTRHLPDIGWTTLVVNVRPSPYPFHYLDFLKELEDQYDVRIDYVKKRYFRRN